MTRVITIAGTAITSTSDLDSIVVGGQAKQGDSALSEMVLYDDSNALFGASEAFIRKQWSVTEDASGTAVYLARGRIAAFETHRGDDDSVQGTKVQYSFALEDQNLELRGHDVNGWVRPAETGYARITALGTAYLNGSPRATTNLNTTTYVPNSNTVSMPAKTYVNADAIDVVQECAAAEDKKFFVTVDHELFYDLESSTAYATTLEISDGVGAAADPDGTNYFAPIWDMGSALTWEGQDYASRVRLAYNQDSSVIVTDATSESAHDRWVAHVADTETTTAAMATAFATAELSARKSGERTYALALKIPAAQAYKIKVGQVIWIQAQAAVDTTARVRRRIAELMWEPDGPYWYIARLNLDRPVRRRVRGSVSGATPIGPHPAPTCEPDEIVSPTTIWNWTYTTDDLDDGTSTYSGGLERTTSGGFGDYPPANAAFGAAYGRNNAGAYVSEKVPISASTLYSFRMDILWRYTPSNRNVDLLWYDVSNNLLRTDRAISGSGRAVDTAYYNAGATFTSPVGATQVQISYTNFAGLFGDNIYIETPGSIIAADNDPYCLVAGPGDSPYFAKSDDPRFASMEQQIADLEGATGSSLDWFIVTDPDYGATGDGTTDDTTAIQAAIDAAEVAGGVVYFPIGNYKITSALSVNPADAGQTIILRGGGFNGSLTDTYGAVIVQATANTTAIAAGANCYHLFVEDLKITGPTGSSSYGINASRNVHCTNVWIEGFWRGYGLLGTSGVQAYYSKNINLTTYGAADTGVYLLAGVNNVDFFGCRMNANGVQGVFIGGAWGVRFFGGAIEGNTTYGARIDSAGSGASGTTQATHSVLFSGAYFENASATDIRVGHDSAGTVNGVTIDSCQFISTATNHITGQYFDGLSLRNNIYQGGKSKVSFTAPGTNLTIIGKEFGTGSYGTLPTATIRLDPSQTLTPVATGTALAAGSGPDVAYKDHVHTNAVIGAVTVSGAAAAGQVPTATSSSAATWQTPSGGSQRAILLESGHAVPFTFDEILQESDGSDFLWASE